MPVYRFSNLVREFQHFIIREAHNTHSQIVQSVGSFHIVCYGLGIAVLATIRFYRQAMLRAIEIQNVPIHWMLPAEFEPAQSPIAQNRPQLSLRICL
jgi:uncharacterized membrane protein YidH (DUF202 family)